MSMEITILKNEDHQNFRPLAKFPPTIWGNHFISFSMDNQAREIYGKENEGLKEEVRMMLLDDDRNRRRNYKISEKMSLINTVERLGVSYHFKEEIQHLLQQILLFDSTNSELQHFDLFTLAIYFRIFRQHGFNISCDVFNKLKDSDGEFKDELKDDVIGMLSLYEATHVRTHGENILDEAFVFAKAQLESMATTLSSPFLAKQVKHALKQALHKGIPRVEARNYISVYEEDPNKNELLLRFSKIDFNLLQMMQKQELCDISRWWKDLDFESKLPYARNRAVECYLWTLSVYYEPQYSFARIILVKTILVLSVTDDTYDAYGTFDELRLYTDAIQRWDMSAINQLPDYMKNIYRVLLDLYDEIEEQLLKQGCNSYGIAYSKEAFKEIVRSYEIESKWFNKKYVPPFEEYMCNALITAANRLNITSSFMGMGELATIQAFEWVQSNPKMIIASNTIVRLIDDIMSHEEEDERGHAATGIECYVKEHGLSKEEVIDEFYKMIENAWKDINEEFIKPNTLSIDILMRVLNLTRIVDVVYKNDDGYTHPEKALKDHIISLFVDPITI